MSRHVSIWIGVGIVLFLGSCQSTSTLNKVGETSQDTIQESISESLTAKIQPVFSKAFEIKPHGNSAPRTSAVYPRRRPVSLAEPFEPGDRAVYHIYYLGLLAGEATFSVLPFQEIKGRKSYHFRVDLETSRMFQYIYRIKNSAESWWDFDGLFSHRFEVMFEDKRQSKKLIELHDQAAKKSHLWSKRISRELGDQEKEETRPSPAWTQDGLSALAYPLFLPLVENTLYQFPAITEGKSWTAKIQVMQKESVRHPVVGPVPAIRIHPSRVFDNPSDAPPGNVDLTTWITQEPRRFLLMLEARTKFGLIKIVLNEYVRSGKTLFGAKQM